jgi:F-type H+-transporting ATPase subunit delta
MRGRPKGAPFSAWVKSQGDENSVEHSGGIQASLSGRYAMALFELARDAKQIDAVSTSLANIKAALGESEEFRRLTSSPLVSREDAVKAVQATASALKCDDITGKFLGVLATNRRLGQLGAVIRAFNLLAAQHRGETTAIVTSAHPLDDDQITALKAKLKSELKRDVALDLNVDPDILGGLIVKVGSRQIDGSIRTKLNTLAQRMKG